MCRGHWIICLSIQFRARREYIYRNERELTTTQNIYAVRYHILSQLMYIDWTVAVDWLESVFPH